MPKWFYNYLQSLSMEKAIELWTWLDSEPDAVISMIEVAGSDDTVYEKVTGHARHQLKA